MYLAQIEVLPYGTLVKVQTAQGGNVNLRQFAGLKANIIGTVPNNTELTILNYAGKIDNYDWYYVKLPDGKTGYVAGQFLKVIPATEKKWDITNIVHDVSMSIQSLFNWLSAKEQAKVQPVESETPTQAVQPTIIGLPVGQFIILSLIGVGGILLIRKVLK